VSEAAKERARSASASAADQYRVTTASADEVTAWIADGSSSVFLCDVRTPDEFAAGSLPHAQLAPGGQLIQSTDLYIGVRHARIVVFDDDGIRAPVVASWLKQLGHNAVVLKDGLRSGLSMPATPTMTPPAPAAISVAQLAAGLQTLAKQLHAFGHKDVVPFSAESDQYDDVDDFDLCEEVASPEEELASDQPTANALTLNYRSSKVPHHAFLFYSNQMMKLINGY